MDCFTESEWRRIVSALLSGLCPMRVSFPITFLWPSIQVRQVIMNALILGLSSPSSSSPLFPSALYVPRLAQVLVVSLIIYQSLLPPFQDVWQFKGEAGFQDNQDVLHHL